MRAFILFSNEQEKRFKNLLFKLRDLLDQNRELKDSFQLLSNKHDKMMCGIECLEAERKQDKLIISQLEDIIETLEKSRASSIEIRNVPKSNGETK